MSQELGQGILATGIRRTKGVVQRDYNTVMKTIIFILSILLLTGCGDQSHQKGNETASPEELTHFRKANTPKAGEVWNRYESKKIVTYGVTIFLFLHKG
jgi:hypothetical protein